MCELGVNATFAVPQSVPLIDKHAPLSIHFVAVSARGPMCPFLHGLVPHQHREGGGQTAVMTPTQVSKHRRENDGHHVCAGGSA